MVKKTSERKISFEEKSIRGKIITSGWMIGCFSSLIALFVTGFIEGVIEGDSNEVFEFNWIISTLIVYAFGVIFCYRDQKILEEAGYKPSTMVFFPPTYLYERARMLQEPNVIMWAWLVLFLNAILSFFL
ncbi:MAG: hypothetical protein LBU87_06200 [Lactobacillales bacterium]|jgi:hypothetical protein|nr:hypothetical protein [Lactobacillales bacterium]